MKQHLAAIFFISSLALAQNSPKTAQPQIGYKSAADAEQKKTVLLRDFKPVSMLHVPVHQINKSKFYVIDVHNHVNDAARIDDPMPPEQVIRIMDATNVKTIVILTGMWGEKLAGRPRPDGQTLSRTLYGLHPNRLEQNRRSRFQQ